MDFANKAVFIQCLEALRLKMCLSKDEQMEAEINLKKKKKKEKSLFKKICCTDRWLCTWRNDQFAILLLKAYSNSLNLKE